MKKLKLLVSIICFFGFLILPISVNALATLSIDEGDYQLKCIYNNIELTIAKSGIYVINNSIEVSGNSQAINNVSFYLDENQEPKYDSDGKIYQTNYDSTLNDIGGCPARLYLLRTEEIVDEEAVEVYYVSNKDFSKAATFSDYLNLSYDQWTKVNLLDDKYKKYYRECTSYYKEIINGWQPGYANLIDMSMWYSTVCGDPKSHFYKSTYFNGTYNATLVSDVVISLKSEEIYLTTNKTTTICDYATSDGDTVSIYNYANVSILEMKDKSTVLDMKNFKIEVDGKEKDIKSVGTGYLGCPAHLTTKEKQGNNPGQRYLFVNNPFPKDVIGSVDTTYNNVRFYAFESANKSLVPYAQKACKQLNNGQDCIFYEYIGSRNGIAENDTDVCDLLGNNVIIVLLKILGWLQILVPVIVIVLTAIDIVKMVLAGNIEEELPKKRKLIIIRVIVMVVFFFIPLIARLISVSIYGENLNECIYSDGSNSGNNNIVDNDNKVPSGNGGSNSNKNTTTVVN